MRKAKEQVKKTLGLIDYSQVTKQREQTKSVNPKPSHKRATTQIDFEKTIRLTKGLNTKK